MKKANRITLWGIVIALGMIPVTGCADKEPDDVAREFFDAKKDTDYQASYALMSDEDKKFYSLENARKEMESLDVYWAAKVLENTTYTITGYEVDGDRAVVTYEVAEPDLDHVYGRAAQVALDEPGNYKSNYEEFMNDYVDENSFRISTRVDELELVLEDGWKVYANIEEMQRKSKAKRLYNDALMAEIDDDLESAADLYGELLELAPEYKDASEKLDAIRDEMSLEKEQASYAANNVVVYDVVAKYFESRHDASIPGLTYKIKNTGDQTLDKVAVRFGFLDSKGAEIYQDVLHPVLVSDYSYLDEPLSPGHIWSTERGRFHAMRRVPDEWQSGQVTAEVVEVEFSED